MGRIELYRVIFEEVGYPSIPPFKAERLYENEEALKKIWEGDTGRFKLVEYERITEPEDSFYVHAGIYKKEDILWPEE